MEYADGAPAFTDAFDAANPAVWTLSSLFTVPYNSGSSGNVLRLRATGIDQGPRATATRW